MNTIRKELTKKFLQETCHVTTVTADGSIYVNGKLKKTQAVTKQHPFGKPTTYLKINLYYSIIDIGEFGEEVVINKCYSTTVARLMLAWWTGSIKNNEDADHINQNKFDNHIYNLRKISRKENLLNRRDSQLSISKRYYQIKKYLEQNENVDKKELLEKFYNE